MFKDTEKALRELEAELLAEEPLPPANTTQETDPQDIPEDPELLSDEELDALLEDSHIIGRAVVYRNHSNSFGNTPTAYNTDHTDLDPQTLSQELENPKQGSTTGLLITAAVLSTAIIGVLIYLLVRYGGIF